MCNRYVQKGNYAHLDREFSIQTNLFTCLKPELFPMRDALVVRPKQDQPGREAAVMRWGLVPSWSDNPKAGRRMTNARSEKVANTPAFRSAFKSRRCLIPADWFLECQKLSAMKMQPYHVRLKDESVFTFAGLWECWHPPGGEPVETCTSMTTEANELVKPLHDRMSVIIDGSDRD